MNRTSIEWTDFTANPLKYRDAAGHVVWGCVHASPGCQNCYAETLAKRYGRGGPFTVPVMNGLTPFLDDDELHKMLTAKSVGGKPVSGSKCFPFDMTDVFGEWVPNELLDRIFAVLAIRDDVTWQLLTKRAERMRAYLSDPKTPDRIANIIGFRYAKPERARSLIGQDGTGFSVAPRWPLPNVWPGVSGEDQERYEDRVIHLMRTPATVRFVSVEPVLGDIDLRLRFHSDSSDPTGPRVRDLIHWVIVGAESGVGARPPELRWIRSLVRQCQAAGVAAFVKQLGPVVETRNDDGFEGDTPTSWPMDTRTRDVDLGYQGDPLHVFLRKKGGDPSQWPEDLRVREYPEVRA